MTRFFLLPMMLVAAPAIAAPSAQAQFGADARLPAKIVVGDSLWSCSGTTCTGPGDARQVAMQRACATLSRTAAVTALSVGEANLDADALARCNAKAGHTASEVAAK